MITVAFFAIFLKEVRRRALMLFLAWDHAIFATFTLGNCREYEMISSSLWRQDQAGKLHGRILRPVVDVLLYVFTGPHHCQQSYEWQQHIYESTQ